jgi:hypothetical protein
MLNWYQGFADLLICQLLGMHGLNDGSIARWDPGVIVVRHSGVRAKQGAALLYRTVY